MIERPGVYAHVASPSVERTDSKTSWFGKRKDKQDALDFVFIALTTIIALSGFSMYVFMVVVSQMEIGPNTTSSALTGIFEGVSTLLVYVCAYIGDSLIGTYPLWYALTILYITSSIFAILTFIPFLSSDYSLLLIIKLYCIFTYVMNNVSIGIYMALGNKEHGTGDEDVTDLRACVYLLSYNVAKCTGEILQLFVFAHDPLHVLYQYILVFVITIVVFVAMVAMRQVYLKDLRFEYRIIDNMILCAFAALKKKGWPWNWDNQPEERWVDHASDYSSMVREKTRRFFRLLLICLFIIPLGCSQEYLLVCWEQVSVYMNHPGALILKIPTHIVLVWRIVFIISLPVGLYIVCPLVFRSLTLRKTALRYFGFAYILMIFAVLSTLIIFLCIGPKTQLMIMKQKFITVMVFNGGERARFVSKWDDISLAKGSHITKLITKRRDFVLVTVISDSINYTKPIFIGNVSSACMTIGESGIIKVNGTDPLMLNNISGLVYSKIIVISSLKNQINLELTNSPGAKYTIKTPVQGETASFNVKPGSGYEATFAEGGKFGKFDIVPESVSILFVYSVNATPPVVSFNVAYKKSYASLGWLWLPMILSSLSTTTYAIASMHLGVLESPFSILCTFFIIANSLRIIGERLSVVVLLFKLSSGMVAVLFVLVSFFVMYVKVSSSFRNISE